MTTELLLVQLLVLGATGVLFWLARRDLASRAPTATPARTDTQELEQLCVTLEALVTDLSHRLDRVERQTARAAPTGDAPRFGEPDPYVAVGAGSPRPFDSEGPAFTPVPEAQASAPVEASDARYAPVYALLDAGETDPQEIARRTGLSRGEVDLILSLRARRAL